MKTSTLYQVLGYVVGANIGFVIANAALLPAFVDILIVAYCAVLLGFFVGRFVGPSVRGGSIDDNIAFPVALIALTLGFLFCHFTSSYLTQQVTLPLAAAGFLIAMFFFIFSWQRQTLKFRGFSVIAILAVIGELVYIGRKMLELEIF